MAIQIRNMAELVERFQKREFADLLSLANAIDAYVKPVIKRQQDAEERIDGAVTHEEIRQVLAEFV